MLQTGGPQTGNEFPTSSIIQQNNQLLGNPQIQSAALLPTSDPGSFNTTAPQSSFTNPGVANMVKALKGGM